MQHRAGFANLIIVTLALLGSWAAVSARAELIIGDSFDTSHTGTIDGRTPDLADLPGGTWTVSTNYFYTNYGSVDNALWVWRPGDNTGGAATISLASSGAYVKPTQLSVSADLNFYGVAGGTGGLILGFYASPVTSGTAFDPVTGLTGFRITQTGTLILYENGSAASTLAYPAGSFTADANTFYTLSYNIDTTTGSLSDVTFAGQTYAFTSTAFTDAATAYAGVGLRWTGRDTQGYVDNFAINSIPEPAAIALFAIGGLMIATRRRTSASPTPPGGA